MPRAHPVGRSSITPRPPLLVALFALLLSACAGGAGTPDTAGAPTQAVPDGCDPFGPSEDVVEAVVDESARFPWLVDDPVVVDGFDFDEVILGGPSPDGIPPIEEPCFEHPSAGDAWLGPDSPVLAIEVNGDARAYPLAIMTQHEIANDVVGGVPLVVTYCPLCNSGLAFHRTVDGQVLDFGTSGRLYRSNLVMYDRQHRNLWVQFTGRAVVGTPWAGTELERVPTSLLGWEDFKDAHPDGTVLARDTGFDRDYGRNPYPGYEARASDFLFEGPTDDQLPPNTRVVGIAGPEGSDPVAVVLDHLRAQRVISVDVDGGPVTVWWAPGASSALEGVNVDDGRDVGQTVSFRPFTPDGRRLTFQPAADADSRFVDAETGSVWTLAGRATEGPLAGTQLEEIPRDDTFWFVWFAFRPATDVVGAQAAA